MEMEMENSGKHSNMVVRDGTLAEQQMYLLDTGLMTDCTFVVGTDETNKKTFHCHKLMLSKSSPVFYAMFYGELAEKGDIVIDDVAPKSYKKMLEYIYTDIVDLENVEIALGVCYAAHKYLIKFLQFKCEAFIKEHLAARNVCQALEFFRLVGNYELEDFCMEYIKTATADVLAAESFQQADRETLMTILKLEDLNVRSELSLFSACVRWAEAHAQEGHTLRDTLGPKVLRYVRFRTLTAEEFAAHVCPTKILTSAEERDILCRMTANIGRMPVGFSNETNARVPYCGKKMECLVLAASDDELKDHDDDFSLKFSLNTSVVIHGFMVNAWREDVSAPYDEDVEIVLSHGNEVVATIKYEGQVSPESVFKVYLVKPVRINAGKWELSLDYTDISTSYYCSYFKKSTFKLSSGVTLSNVTGYTQICGIMLTTQE